MVAGPGGTFTYYLGDREVTEEEYRAATPSKLALGEESLAGSTKTCWPMTSEALAVHPNQVAKANKRNKEHGVNVVYDPKTGCAVLPDRGERKRLLKLEGFHDNRGGYGD